MSCKDYLVSLFQLREENIAEKLTNGSLVKFYNTTDEMNKLLCSNEKLAIPFMMGFETYEINCKIIIIPEVLDTLVPAIIWKTETGYKNVINHM